MDKAFVKGYEEKTMCLGVSSFLFCSITIEGGGV